MGMETELESSLATGLPDAAGEIACLRAQVASLEQELAAARGERAERSVQVILESSPAAIAVWDAGDRLVAVNGHYRDIFFCGQEHLVRLGDSFTEHARRFADSGGDASVAGVSEDFVVERQRRRLAPGEPFEQRIGDRWILSRESRTPEGGLISVHIDMTPLKRVEQALRESESRFRILADSMPTLLWMDDAEGRCVFVNKTWLDYTGCTMEETLGLGWTRSVHPDDVPKALRMDAEARRECTPSDTRIGVRHAFEAVFRLRRADGEYRWFLDTGAPRYADGNGRLLGFVGTLLDITDRQRLEAELNQTQKMEAIGQLTGGVAHDFNNLLTVIGGNLELAMGRIEDRQVRDMLALALEATERGAALTQRLLAFARRQTLSPQPVELDRLITDFAALLRRTLAIDIEISTVLPRGLWPGLVDPNQLENALLNLAINARDAMAGGGTLTISASNRDVARNDIAGLKPGRYVAIAVTDTGHGMVPELRDKVVQPFFTTKQPGKGSGLGLSMAYGFAKQSGGHLRIDSATDCGTTVEIVLPVAAGLVARRGSGNEEEGVDLLAGSALVVDDDPDVLKVAVAMLESLGYRVTTAVDGPSALRWIHEAVPFDLLLTDVMLPGGMNGAQLAAAALAERPGLRVLLMSGYTEDALVEQGVAATLLNKPFRKRELVAKIRQTLGS